MGTTVLLLTLTYQRTIEPSPSFHPMSQLVKFVQIEILVYRSPRIDRKRTGHVADPPSSETKTCNYQDRCQSQTLQPHLNLCDRYLG